MIRIEYLIFCVQLCKSKLLHYFSIVINNKIARYLLQSCPNANIKKMLNYAVT